MLMSKMLMSGCKGLNNSPDPTLNSLAKFGWPELCFSSNMELLCILLACNYCLLQFLKKEKTLNMQHYSYLCYHQIIQTCPSWDDENYLYRRAPVYFCVPQ